MADKRTCSFSVGMAIVGWQNIVAKLRLLPLHSAAAPIPHASVGLSIISDARCKQVLEDVEEHVRL
jgi:hypothetical protein